MLAEWRELLSLIADIHQQQHLDAEYVFTRLRYDHAFHFVATKTEVGSHFCDSVSSYTQLVLTCVQLAFYFFML